MLASRIRSFGTPSFKCSVYQVVPHAEAPVHPARAPFTIDSDQSNFQISDALRNTGTSDSRALMRASPVAEGLALVLAQPDLGAGPLTAYERCHDAQRLLRYASASQTCRYPQAIHAPIRS